MYNLDHLVGKVVTIKFNNGIEIISLLTAYMDDIKYVTLQEPRTVVAAEKELALIPYLFTSSSKEVIIPQASIQTIVKSLPESAKSYEEIVKEDK